MMCFGFASLRYNNITGIAAPRDERLHGPFAFGLMPHELPQQEQAPVLSKSVQKRLAAQRGPTAQELARQRRQRARRR